MWKKEFLSTMRKIKLIWDFKGPEGLKTAEHHTVHLNEFIEAKQYDHIKTGHEALNEFHAIAYLIVPEEEMRTFRDVLKPHRGQVYEGE